MHISCKTLTPWGSEKLIKCIDDNKKDIQTYGINERKEYFNTWKELVTYTPYCTFTLLLRARSVLGGAYMVTKHFTKSVNQAQEFHKDVDEKFKAIVNEIDTSMLKEGCTPNIDYIIEVVK